MKATTKKELLARYDRHSATIAELTACPRSDTLEPSLIDAVRTSGERLQGAMDQPLRATVPVWLVEMSENLLAKGAALVASRTEDVPRYRDGKGQPCHRDETPLAQQLEAERRAARGLPDPFVWGAETKKIFGSVRRS